MAPIQLICLKPVNIIPVVLNKGISMATTELVALINSDAILEQNDTLPTHGAIHSWRPAKCAGVFARQSVRPDANAMTKSRLPNRLRWRSQSTWQRSFAG